MNRTPPVSYVGISIRTSTSNAFPSSLQRRLSGFFSVGFPPPPQQYNHCLLSRSSLLLRPELWLQLLHP
ncbi:hypothetical protein Bca4012_084100 [Brassica carinata]